MFRSKRRSKKQPTKVMIVPDGRSESTIPNPGGMRSIGVIQTSMHLRFVCGTATTSTVTWANLLDTVIMATTSTQAADVFYSMRLHSVEIWLPPAVQGVAVNSQTVLAFDSPTQGDQRVWIVSSGPTGGYQKCVPSKRSLNGLTWQDSSSVGGFTLNNCPVGALFQINATFRSRMGPGSATIAAQAGSGMTPGVIYLRGFDGLALASTKFPPEPASYGA